MASAVRTAKESFDAAPTRYLVNEFDRDRVTAGANIPPELDLQSVVAEDRFLVLPVELKAQESLLMEIAPR